MKNAGLGPISASVGEFFRGFGIAGNQHGRAVACSQDLDTDTRVAADIAEIAGADEDVGGSSPVQQLSRRHPISVQIAEEQ